MGVYHIIVQCDTLLLVCESCSTPSRSRHFKTCLRVVMRSIHSHCRTFIPVSYAGHQLTVLTLFSVSPAQRQEVGGITSDTGMRVQEVSRMSEDDDGVCVLCVL